MGANITVRVETKLQEVWNLPAQDGACVSVCICVCVPRTGWCVCVCVERE